MISNEGNAPVRPSHAKTIHDALPWPGGKTLGQVPPAEFTARLVAWKIPGAGHDQGRAANAAAYARHIERLRTEGATAVTNAWLASVAP